MYPPLRPLDSHPSPHMAWLGQLFSPLPSSATCLLLPYKHVNAAHTLSFSIRKQRTTLSATGSVSAGVCYMHAPMAAVACLTRARGDDRVVCLSANSPCCHHPLYTQATLASFKAIHSCGNVSIVTASTLYGQQLGVGIWAEALVCMCDCFRLIRCGIHQPELEALQPQLLFSTPVTDQQRISGPGTGSRQFQAGRLKTAHTPIQ